MGGIGSRSFSREVDVENSNMEFKMLGVLFVLFGTFAIVGSILLWGEGFYFDFPTSVDLAIPTADLFINGPASILAGLGLWKTRKWGFAMAWLTAGIYLYASVEVFVWAVQEGSLTPEIVIPQTLAVIAALAVLLTSWKKRNKFH